MIFVVLLLATLAVFSVPLLSVPQLLMPFVVATTHSGHAEVA